KSDLEIQIWQLFPGEPTGLSAAGTYDLYTAFAATCHAASIQSIAHIVGIHYWLTNRVLEVIVLLSAFNEPRIDSAREHYFLFAPVWLQFTKLIGSGIEVYPGACRRAYLIDPVPDCAFSAAGSAHKHSVWGIINMGLEVRIPIDILRLEAI